MATYAATLAQGFSQKVISLFFEKSIAMDITNQDYEGEMKDKLSKLNILTFGAIALRAYSGSAMASADDATESVGVLETNVQRAYYFKIQSLQKFHSWIKNPEGTLLDTIAKSLKQEIDAYVLGFGGDVAAGNRVGTNVDDATTIAVTTGTGAFVVSGGTPVTSAWVGKGIKVVGYAKWLRVASVSSTTEGVLVDDLDDASSYSGGGLSGASYVVEAVTKVQVAKTTIYGYITQLTEKLNEAQIPLEDRFLVVPPKIYTVLKNAGEIQPAVDAAYQDVVKRGYVGDVDGFKLLVSNQVAGNNTDGFQVLAMHKSWLTFAMGMVESGIEDLIADFGKAYKGLTIYGAKVVDERRKAAAMLFCYV
ncbi:MAG: hypothetical protein WA019_04030 [Candidatus Moraniibacteriota bacterium]